MGRDLAYLTCLGQWAGSEHTTVHAVALNHVGGIGHAQLIMRSAICIRNSKAPNCTVTHLPTVEGWKAELANSQSGAVQGKVAGRDDATF